MFNPKQPGCLWDGELKARHFVEFTSDSIDKCARVHDVIPSEDVLSGPSYWGSAQNQSKTHAARFPTVADTKCAEISAFYTVVRVSPREHSRPTAEQSQQHRHFGWWLVVSG